VTESLGRDGGNRAFQSSDIEDGENLHGCRNLFVHTRALHVRRLIATSIKTELALNPLSHSSPKTANAET